MAQTLQVVRYLDTSLLVGHGILQSHSITSSTQVVDT